MTASSPTRLAPVERGLVQVRWLILVIQSSVAVWFLGQGDPVHHPEQILAITAGLFAVEGARLSGIRPTLVQHVAIDLLFLAVLAGFWGPHHPLQLLSLVEVALVATVVSRTVAWTLTTGVVGLLLLDGWLQLGMGVGWFHVMSHVTITLLAAVSLTWFSLAVGGALRTIDEARNEAVLQTDRNARLALVGTLASGVAHELATPLGSITLLAEEALGDVAPESPGVEAIRGLLLQVRRCRDILDRLLDRGDSPHTSLPDLGTAMSRWLAEWSQANPGTTVQVVGAESIAGFRVPGSEGAWRASLWTILDNAAMAGGPVIVGTTVRPDLLILCIDDHGPGPDPEATARAGEPFFSGWRAGGRGLGLYTVRTHLAELGGQFRLQRRDGGGGRVEIRLPLSRGGNP